MEKQEVLLLLDEILELNPGTLTGEESTQGWDSIILISLIALADEHFNKSISVKEIMQADTVNDVVMLLTT